VARIGHHVGRYAARRHRCLDRSCRLGMAKCIEDHDRAPLICINPAA
jgi:hypothetical protein